VIDGPGKGTGMASYLETGFAHLHHCTATRSVSEHNAPLRLLCP
jgi:hypothetical protein